MKRLLIFALAALLLLSLFTIPALAADRYLIDGEGLLTQEEAARVSQALEEISEELDFDVLIRTAPDFGGKSAAGFADDAMDEEYGASSSALLLLISIRQGEWFVATEESVSYVIDDRAIDSIMDQVRPSLRSGDYEKAFFDFVSGVKEHASGSNSFPWDGSASGTPSYLSSSHASGKSFHFSPIALIISLVAALLIATVTVWGMKSQLKSARFQNANQYLLPGSFCLTQNVDLFLYKNVTKVKIESDSSSSHGGGGFRTSSSGHSHGGHGGRI